MKTLYSLFAGRRARPAPFTRGHSTNRRTRRPTPERLESRSLLTVTEFPFALESDQSGGGNSVATDASGNVFVAGASSGTTDFDPGPGTANLSGNNGFLAKYSPGGTLAWVRSLGGANSGKFVTKSGNATSVQVDADGNAYLAGVFKGSVSLTGINGSNPNPGLSLTSHNRGKATDGFLLKFNTFGSVDTGWIKQFGGDKGNLTDAAVVIHTAAGAVDGVFITGVFSGTVDFNPNPSSFATVNRTSAGFDDVFVVKLDGSGNHAWSMQAGSTGFDSSHDIAVAADGSAYVVGYFEGSNPFGPSHALMSSGSKDGFAAKLNPNGTVGWATKMGGAGFDRANSIIATDAALYVAGSFEGAGAFGTFQTLNSLGESDAFVSMLTMGGVFQWTKQLGGAGIQSAGDLAIDEANNVYVGGNFRGTADFNPDPGTDPLNVYSLTPVEGSQDGFVVRLDQNGNFGGWATRLGGPNNSQNLDLTWDTFSNSVFTTGYFFFGTLEACTRDTCSTPPIVLTNSSLQGGGNGYVMQLDVTTGLPLASTDTSNTLLQPQGSTSSSANDLALLSLMSDLNGSPTDTIKKRL